VTVPESKHFDAERAISLARSTLEIEAEALLGLVGRQGATFAAAAKAMFDCRGRVAVMGIGKSGHICRKIAATLSSTGTPAMFVHVAEASHGDLGMVTADDLILVVSNSGEGDELNALMPMLKRLGIPLIAITGNSESTLARYSDIVLDSSVAKEACPLNLAPTASTTAQMALGDALAVALLDARGFRAEDFARSHPGGSLGPRVVQSSALAVEAADSMERYRVTSVLVTDDDGILVGVLNSNDLMRAKVI
jgi:arabinose-5-phosphate isomerase